MSVFEYLLIGVSILICLLFLSLFFKKKSKVRYSHKWREKSAEKILIKIQTFNEGQIFSYLRKIDPFIMEELILSALEKREDIEIKRNSKYTGDNGVDGRFFIHRENNGKKERLKCIIQSKRYNSLINPKHLKEFANQIKYEKAYLGLFIHTGKTSANSFVFARSESNLKIISGVKLIKLLKGGSFE